MAKKPKDTIKVRRHLYAELDLVEIRLDELDQLARESQGIGDNLSFAIFGWSVALTIVAMIATVQIPSNRVYYSFFIVMCLGVLVGLYCGVRWIISKRNFEGTVQRIKSRIGPLGDDESGIAPDEAATLPSEAKPRGDC